MDGGCRQHNHGTSSLSIAILFTSSTSIAVTVGSGTTSWRGADAAASVGCCEEYIAEHGLTTNTHPPVPQEWLG